MRRQSLTRWLLAGALAGLTAARSNVTYIEKPYSLFSTPDDCPPCFNCNLDVFHCQQYAACNQYNGKCSCAPGFGGDACSEPLCGALTDGDNRLPREDKYCQCKDGWEGINCNVCTENKVCNAMTPEGKGGVCYKGGVTVEQNFQMCNVTNQKILEQLKDKLPQVTFSCTDHKDEQAKSCNFEFWVDQKESFYCALDECNWELVEDDKKNQTKYHCEKIKCECVPGRMLCGEDGSIDIGDFLTHEIKGPADFSCRSTDGGSSTDGCKFEEPGMNGLISSVFGDESIFLDCRSGECLHMSKLPGYKPPGKEINTPLIAGVIAGASLFVVAAVLLIWYLSRRSALRSYGEIQLPTDEDDDMIKLMADHKPASLYFKNVSYRINDKQILYNVSGVAHPGQLLAIMGPSGAGKTSFLDILARKNKRGNITGDLYVNGEKVSDNDYRSVVGFVDQEDTMLPTLTVHETILNSALLRLPRDMSYAAKEQRAFEVEKQLGIYHIKDQMIGSEESGGRGISGGEKRRVGIACELVTSPSILFLDEPTSGLDAFNAFNVIECLVTLAKNYNRTLIFTIHQPRSNIVALFDQLILLAKGNTVYSGSMAKCQSYFDDLGYSCPPGFNVADYLVDLTMHASTVHTLPTDDAAQLGDYEGLRSRTSSTRAIKSIASVSSLDQTQYASPTESSRRPGPSRKESLKQRQDRQLFARKKSGVATPGSLDEAPLGSDSGAHAQWLGLSTQRGNPSLNVDDPHHLPPSVTGTGTDLDDLVTSYARSDLAKSVREDIDTTISDAMQPNGANGNARRGSDAGSVTSPMKGFKRVGLWTQFKILSGRTWKNLYRNPMLMLTHYAIAIVLAVLCGYLFYGVTDDIAGFQNRLGLFFFILALFGFSTLTSLTVFASERLLFMRERANGYYAPFTYYSAKVMFDIVPLRLIPPILTAAIVYPMVGLYPQWSNFFKFVLILVLFNLAAAAICLFIGIVIKDGGVANLIGSLVMLFSLLFAGLLLNHDAIPKTAQWLQYLSIFHYGFEAAIVNEVRYLTLIQHKLGLDIEVPGALILSTFGFDTLSFWNDVVGLAVISGSFIVLAYLAMHFLLIEKR